MDKCSLLIDEKFFSFDVEGEFSWGEDKFLFDINNNMISNTKWVEDGFTIINLFEDQDFKKLKENIANTIYEIGIKSGINFPKKFNIQKYHEYIKNDDDHLKIINKTRELRDHDFNFDLSRIAKVVSNSIGVNLTSYNSLLKRTHVQMRINRPFSTDYNPPHKDAYLPYYEDVINIWIPICGCDQNSSLPLMPKSHLMNESSLYKSDCRSAKINNITYNVPCILKVKGEFKLIRPNPVEKKAIIFSPYLIHGAASNNNTHTTRIALELRLSRKN